MPWHTGRLASFDLETTGTNPEEARIVSAAFLWLSPTGEVLPNSFSRLADPETEIPEEASAVHGITAKEIEREALSRGEILGRIAASMALAKAVRIPLVIYNAKYDLTVFLAELNRIEAEIPRLIPPIIDPLVIDRALDKYRKGKRTLETVAQYYGVQLDDAHAAAADAVAAASLARRLAETYPLPLRDLDALQGQQAKWHEQWRRGINDYWKRKGIDKNIPDHEVWPSHLLTEQL